MNAQSDPMNEKLGFIDWILIPVLCVCMFVCMFILNCILMPIAVVDATIKSTVAYARKLKSTNKAAEKTVKGGNL